MYFAIIVLALALSVFLSIRGRKRGSRTLRLLAVVLGVGVLVLFSLLGLWGEALWFESVGYARRFGVEWLVRGLLFLGGGMVAGGGVYALLSPLTRGGRGLDSRNRGIRRGGALVTGLLGGFASAAKWELVLLLVYGGNSGVLEPALGMDVSFYLFVLPILESLGELFWMMVLLAFGTALTAILAGGSAEDGERLSPVEDFGQAMKRVSRRRFALFAPLAVFALLLLAYGRVLDIFQLLYSPFGVVQGPGWTDMHVRLPGYAALAVIFLLFALIIGWPGMRRRVSEAAFLPRFAGAFFGGKPAAVVAVLAAAIWFVLLGIGPGLTQWLLVEPNEITYERPYIANSIAMTRKAFKLEKVEERRFPQTGELNRKVVADNRDLFENIRLWDWRALDAVFRQFQEIRLYYQFADVDVDRYHLKDGYRQVMISAREMNIDNLPAQSNTFINRRFKYTHGYGAALTGVSQFTSQGLPRLLVKDLPPRSEDRALAIDNPAIYYGELTREPVVVNTREPELDYPSGEDNVLVHYAGTGGVPMETAWRKFLFGWKFDGTRLFMSGYPQKGTRIQFHRRIQDRLKTLAPFLDFDADPYVVIAHGRMYWIVDGYTSSGYYPYSESFSSRGEGRASLEPEARTVLSRVSDGLSGRVNYVRNSVKVVVDAYNGDVDFYVFDTEDPIIDAWRSAFPEMFHPREAMDAELEKHIRYPTDMLLLQGLVYAKFHMTNPSVFYNQEDLWVRATEKYYNRVIPVSPYYVMWEPPERDATEYVLILPFTPKNRQVLIGWIAGMCDGENYGRLLAYKFPKEKRVLGPQQVETKIDQDSFLSGQLSLWDQRGSNVIRGNVLAIPVDETLLYVEPIYLQAETAAYPELRLVVLMHGDELYYAETFEKALQQLLGEAPPEKSVPRIGAGDGQSAQALIDHASEAFDAAMRALGEHSFQQASQALDRLQRSLTQLKRLHGEAASGEAGGAQSETGQGNATSSSEGAKE